MIKFHKAIFYQSVNVTLSNLLFIVTNKDINEQSNTENDSYLVIFV